MKSFFPMSLIRNTTNPEKLYIYECTGGKIAITQGYNRIHMLPAGTFRLFARKCLKDNPFADTKYGKWEVKEQFIRTGGPRRNTSLPNGNYKMVLYYDGKEITRMYYVTWEHIIRNACDV